MLPLYREAETMKAVRVKKHGGIDELFLDDVQKPTPGVRQVLIKVLATAVNRADVLQVICNQLSMILTFKCEKTNRCSQFFSQSRY